MSARRAVFPIILTILIVGCSSASPAASGLGGSSPPSATPVGGVPSPTEPPSIDAALLESHESACQTVDANYVADGGQSWLEGVPRVLVLQTYDRPVHFYTDGTRYAVCVARAGVEPAIYSDEMEAAGPALVMPVACHLDIQFGEYVLCLGTVDPLVAGVSTLVPGVGEVRGVLAGRYFMIQWPGDHTPDGGSWTAYDSCGAAIQVITLEGAPTACPAL